MPPRWNQLRVSIDVHFSPFSNIWEDHLHSLLPRHAHLDFSAFEYEPLALTRFRFKELDTMDFVFFLYFAVVP